MEQQIEQNQQPQEAPVAYAAQPDAQPQQHVEDSRTASAGDVQKTGEMSPVVAPQGPAMSITRIIVHRDRMLCELTINQPKKRYTTPVVAQKAINMFPTLPQHACVNDEGDTFGDVINHTDLPHLLEHIVIDLQVRATDNPRKIYTGVTRWTDPNHLTACVEMNYSDDIVALKAFRDGVDIINNRLVL